MDLQLDNDGKSKGLGVVQYSHPIEAVQVLRSNELWDKSKTNIGKLQLSSFSLLLAIAHT